VKGILLSLSYFLGLHVDLQLSHKVGTEIKLGRGREECGKGENEREFRYTVFSCSTSCNSMTVIGPLR